MPLHSDMQRTKPRRSNDAMKNQCNDFRIYDVEPINYLSKYRFLPPLIIAIFNVYINALPRRLNHFKDNFQFSLSSMK